MPSPNPNPSHPSPRRTTTPTKSPTHHSLFVKASRYTSPRLSVTEYDAIDSLEDRRQASDNMEGSPSIRTQKIITTADTQFASDLALDSDDSASPRSARQKRFDSPLIVRSSALVTHEGRSKKRTARAKKKQTEKAAPVNDAAPTTDSPITVAAPRSRKRKGSFLKVSIRAKTGEKRQLKPAKRATKSSPTNQLSSNPLLTKVKSPRDTDNMQSSFEQFAPFLNDPPQTNEMRIQIPERDLQDWTPAEWQHDSHGAQPLSATPQSSSVARNIFHGGMIPRTPSSSSISSPTRSQRIDNSLHWTALKTKQYEMTPPSSVGSDNTYHTYPSRAHRAHRRPNKFTTQSIFSSDDDEDRIEVDPNHYSPLKGSSHRYPPRGHTEPPDFSISGSNPQPLSRTMSLYAPHPQEEVENEDELLEEDQSSSSTPPPQTKKYHPLNYLKSNRKQAFKRRFKQLVQAYSSTHETNPQILKKRYEFLIRSLADAEMIERQKPTGTFRSKTNRFQTTPERLSVPPATLYSPHESKDLILTRPKSAVPFSKQGTPRFVESIPLNPIVCYGQQDVPRVTKRSSSTSRRHSTIQARPGSAWAKAPERFDPPKAVHPRLKQGAESQNKSPHMEPEKLTDMEYMISQLEQKNREMDDRLIRMVETYDYFQRQDMLAEARLDQRLKGKRGR